MLEQSSANFILDFRDSVAQLFRDSLSLQRIYGVGVCRGRHNNESYDSVGCASLLHAIVQAFTENSQRLGINFTDYDVRASDSMNMSTPLLRYS